MFPRSVLRSPCPSCPLTPIQRTLLQTAIDLGTLATETLARHLHRSPHTIRTDFKRIARRLNTTGREEAIFRGLRERWLEPTFLTGRERERRSVSNIALNVGHNDRSVSRHNRNMRREDQEDFVDLVAQAVIDRIEERDRIEGLVNLVVARVFEMQRQASAMQNDGGSPDVPAAVAAPDSEREEVQNVSEK
ncbi:MAG: helix-turn-helix transcriptional regulator [Capsulimonadales bacterium]|nr:helix-turn-helix transcriptional regulator [Capsulimonadales bacterium]